MNTKPILLALAIFAAACSSEPPDVIVVVEPGEQQTVTNTVYETNTVTTTVTETETVEVPAEIPPTLTISYTTVFSGNGDWVFERGVTSVDFGAFQFIATEGMWVDEFHVQTYVDSNPSLFGQFQQASDGVTQFATNFENCVLQEYTTGNIMAGPANPDPLTGKIPFVDLYLDATTDPIYNVRCDHTGAWPSGEYDAFAVDFAYSSDAVAETDLGDAVEIAFGNTNGGNFPSMSRVLQDSACTFDVEYGDGLVAQMHNEVSMALSGWSPSGASIPGYQEVLNFYVFNNHVGCSIPTVDGLTFWVGASDNAGTGWHNALPFDLVDLATGIVLYSGTVPANEPLPLSFTSVDSAHLAVRIDTTGASAADDDTIQVQIMADTMNWNDSVQIITDAESDLVTGGILIF